MNRSRIWFFIGALVVVSIGLILIWGPNGPLKLDNPEDLANVAVEFHGMIFDVILFGIILTYFEHRLQKSELKQKYQEEIFDFLGWDEKEATVRITSRIRQLNKLGVTQIKLFDANLSEALLMEANLSGAFLKYANLRGASLRTVDFSNADMEKADLTGAYLSGLGIAPFNTGANLSNANLVQAVLVNANLSGANLSDADLSDADLSGANLSRANLKGVRVLKKQLLNVKSLYDCQNLDPVLKDQLEKEKPCLFTEEGCTTTPISFI